MREFAALADPTRRRIVELLAIGERSAGELVDEFDFSGPAISQHLKTLRDAGLVQVRVDAQRRIYAIDRNGFDNVDAWLQGVRKFWTQRLDALERELRKAADSDRNKAKLTARSGGSKAKRARADGARKKRRTRR
jgi:DNA-binding transcriptional ArsR family regulator